MTTTYPTTSTSEYSSAVQLVDMHPHPDNPRQKLSGLTDLAKSIANKGVLSPLLLAANGDGFTILAGHRRHAAAIKAGLDVAPALIHTGLSETEMLEIILTENLNREDLTVTEEAISVAKMVELGTKVGDIAKRAGKSTAWVNTRLKLMELPKPVRLLIDSNDLTIEDALELVPYAVEHGDILVEWAKSDNPFPSQVEGRINKVRLDNEAQEAITKLVEGGDKVLTDMAQLIEGKYAIVLPPEQQYGAPKKVKLLPLDPKAHRKEQCHASFVYRGDAYARKVHRFEVCTAPKAHSKAGSSPQKVADSKHGIQNEYERAKRAAEKEDKTRRLVAMQSVLDSDSKDLVPFVASGIIQRVGRETAKEACLVLGIKKEDWPTTGYSDEKDPKLALAAYAGESTRQQQRAINAIEISHRSYETQNKEFAALLKANGYKSVRMPKPPTDEDPDA